MLRTGHERTIALFGLLASTSAILVALGSERFLGLIPCAFCLIERRPWVGGIILSALALVVPRGVARALLWLLLALVLVAAGLSFVHVGVEQHWWQDPLPACTAPNLSGMNAAQRMAALPARPAKPCEDPDFLIPGLPVSMTQMAFLYALAVGAALAISLSTQKGRRRR